MKPEILPHAMNEEQLLAFLREHFDKQEAAFDEVVTEMEHLIHSLSRVENGLASYMSTLLMGQKTAMKLYQESIDSYRQSIHRIRESNVHLVSSKMLYNRFTAEAIDITMRFHRETRAAQAEYEAANPREPTTGSN